MLLLKSTVTRYSKYYPNPDRDKTMFLTLCYIKVFIYACSSVVEDCEEAFVKNPDSRPLVLYLQTGEDHNLTGPTRQLLERVNAADKAAKVKVCLQVK